MRIYLMRHGRAEHHATGGDARRALSAEGEREVHNVGDGLARQGISFDLVFTSPLLRAARTANLICDHAAQDFRPIETPVLAQGGQAVTVLQLLQDHPDAEHVLFVGHLPMIGEWIGELISEGGMGAALHVSPASMGCLELFSIPLTEPANLLWFCTARQLCASGPGES